MSENEWKISKSGTQCLACNTPFVVGAPYFSALFQTKDGLTRSDWCETCFQTKRPADVYYFWKTTAVKPDAQAPKKARPLVDLDHVMEFFKRLEEDGGSQKIAFRYILALMLSRKKALFAGERKKDAQGRTVQNYREKKSGADLPVHAVVEPDLSEAEIQNLSSELGLLLGLGPMPENAGSSVSNPVDAQSV